MGFVHLHNHTEYSLLIGMSKVKALVARSSHLGMSAVATTCLLYTSPSPRDLSTSRMPSSA